MPELLITNLSQSVSYTCPAPIGIVVLPGTSEQLSQFPWVTVELIQQTKSALLSAVSARHILIDGSSSVAGAGAIIDSLSAEIDTIQTDIATNAGDIGQLILDVGTLAGDVGTLAGDVLTLEDGGFVGSSRWEDLRFPATSARLPPAGIDPPVIGVWLPADGAPRLGQVGALFEASKDETLFFNVQLPHAWKLGTELRPHIHWSPTTALAGTVIWRLEYTIAEVNGVFPVTVHQDITVDAGAGAQYKHVVSSFTPISMAGVTNVSTMLLLSITRVVAGDSYAGSVVLHEFDIHYLVDSTGSDNELSKTSP